MDRWSSVTRFGEIPPLWQKIKSLWKLFIGLFSIWHYFWHSLAILICHCFWLNIEQIILQSGHTVHLLILKSSLPLVLLQGRRAHYIEKEH